MAFGSIWLLGEKSGADRWAMCPMPAGVAIIVFPDEETAKEYVGFAGLAEKYVPYEVMRDRVFSLLKSLEGTGKKCVAVKPRGSGKNHTFRTAMVSTFLLKWELAVGTESEPGLPPPFHRGARAGFPLD